MYHLLLSMQKATELSEEPPQQAAREMAEVGEPPVGTPARISIELDGVHADWNGTVIEKPDGSDYDGYNTVIQAERPPLSGRSTIKVQPSLLWPYGIRLCQIGRPCDWPSIQSWYAAFCCLGRCRAVQINYARSGCSITRVSADEE